MKYVLRGYLEWRNPKSEEFLNRPRVVRQARDHPWGALHLLSSHLYPKRVVRSNKVVGRSSEEKLPLESLCALPGMPGPTGQCWEPGLEGGIEPLDERSVDRTPLAPSHLNHMKGLEQITEGQSALGPLSVCPHVRLTTWTMCSSAYPTSCGRLKCV